MYYLYILTFALSLAAISGCMKSDSAEIEAELQTYFDQFVAEAAARDQTIDVEALQISGYVEQIEERGTLGQCKSYADGSKTVVIDQFYWRTASDEERQYVVFHELGHCALGRDHDNSTSPDGICSSIMQSGIGVCESIFDEDNRTVLLDELFKN